MPKARKSSSRRRMNRFEEKYSHTVIPLRYKVYIDPMETSLRTELINYDELERQLFEEFEDQGLPSEVWPFYVALAKRAFTKCLRFSCQTYEEERALIQSEFTSRGLNATIITRVLEIADTKCMLVKETVVTLQDLEDKLDNLLSDAAILHFELHSRYRVYPQDVTVAPTLTAAAIANVFGPWAEVIPLNTIPFPFHIIGFCICEVSAATNYHVQLGYNTVSADPPANYEMGERRVRFAAVPISKQTELLTIRGQGIPANSRVMARLKTASGNPDTATISVVLTRHLEVSQEKDLYPSFPW